ncbi:hypothetical protein TNCV_4967581 [Trichonephila clavipes]|nr:hypothetical protein TNCV_4967581 [Trichonephila clavipes]
MNVRYPGYLLKTGARRGPEEPEKAGLNQTLGYKLRSSSPKGPCNSSAPRVQNELKLVRKYVDFSERKSTGFDNGRTNVRDEERAFFGGKYYTTHLTFPSSHQDISYLFGHLKKHLVVNSENRPEYCKMNCSKTVLRMSSTYRCAVSVSLITTKRVRLSKEMAPQTITPG